MTHRLRRLLADEQGSVALYVVVVAPVLLLAALMLSDLSARVQTISRTQSVAQEAARAGGQQLGAGAVTGHAADLDGPRAAAAARGFLRTTGNSGSVSVTGSTVNVSASQTWTPRFLGVVGVGPQTITQTATINTHRVRDGQEVTR